MTITTEAPVDRLADLATGTRLAWAAFVDAVHHHEGGQVLDAFRAYWRMRRDTLAEHARNPYAPAAALPQLVGDEQTLRAEFDWLRGWSPAYVSGTVEGRATSAVGEDSLRAITAEERQEYERRATAYRAAVEAFNHSARVLDQHSGGGAYFPTGVNQYGFRPPVIAPHGRPAMPRPAPDLPGSVDFSTALTTALTTETEN